MGVQKKSQTPPERNDVLEAAYKRCRRIDYTLEEVLYVWLYDESYTMYIELIHALWCKMVTLLLLLALSKSHWLF